VDVGCGKGEILIRVAERWSATGVGVDPALPFLEEAHEAAERRVGAGRLEFLATTAEEAELEPGSFDLAINVGASHAYGGYRHAPAALAQLVRPGGQVLYGEGFWRRDPIPEYLAALGAEADELPHYGGLAHAGDAAGLEPTYIAVSSEDDWDRYEWGLRHNVERYVAEHPGEPGIDGLLEWSRAARERYTGPGGRDTLGFALVLFRRER
jgi:SAM-dependent methyltransferase